MSDVSWRGAVMGAPSMVTLPLVGCSRPAAICSVLDLPHPDGPMIATDSPFATEKLSPSSASVPFPPSDE